MRPILPMPEHRSLSFPPGGAFAPRTPRFGTGNHRVRRPEWPLRRIIKRASGTAVALKLDFHSRRRNAPLATGHAAAHFGDERGRMRRQYVEYTKHPHDPINAHDT